MLGANACSRTSRSVLDWLEKTQCFAGDRAIVPYQPALNGTKRKQDSQSQSQYSCKSRSLVEIPSNIMRQGSARKRSKNVRDPATPPEFSAQHELGAEDTGETPRPSGRSARLPPPFDGHNVPPFETFEPLNSSRSNSTVSSYTHNSTRSRSPQKHLGHSYLSNVTVDRKALTSHTVPPELCSLYYNLSAISSGVGVIPRSVESYIRSADIPIQSHELRDLQEEDDIYWEPKAFFQRLHEVWEAATDCLERNVAEPRWNAEVHSRLLFLALRSQWKSKGIWYEDITTARISDKDLLAKIGTLPVPSKLVDYAIMIDPDHGLKRRIAQAARASTQSPAWSINCTPVEYIQLNPIAINIETKREMSSHGDPYQQLGTWTSAHYFKLHQLTTASTKLPAMPLLSVDGHRWRLMVAVWHVEPDGYRLEILSNLTLGETSTLPGVYRVVAAIRRLARWVDEEYRVWFEENILKSR